MISLTLNAEPIAQSVETLEFDLVVRLADFSILCAPLVWFPRLNNATPSKRKSY